jgi:carboxyl-terminal processing protease
MRSPLASALFATWLLGTSLVTSACGDDSSDRERYAARCAMPRSGDRFEDMQGSLDDEKKFLRAWINDLYLWYREVPSVNPADFETAVDYFDALKTPAITASGKPKDQFHFIYPSDVWEQLSRSGVEGGYGVTWALLASRPPRQIVAAYTEPGSAATAAGIRRGTSVISVDGVDVANGSDVDTLNAGLFPDELGKPHTFVVRDYGSADTRTITMTSASVQSSPVQNVKTIDTPTGKVGYLTFNDHIGTAELGLFNAITQLQAEQITDLVLDLRYNGGGYLAIAAELSYMIAGPTATSGKAFERLTYNDRYRKTDPFSGEKLTPSPFLDTALGFSTTAGRRLPALSLPRVFVLTGPGTCSASESIINGLRGVDVEVIQIGATTCGKPYGFFPQDNCGTTYFAIQFQGVNDKGFGDYADGFTPGGGGGNGAAVPGCVIADDLSRALGDANEGRLSAALAYRATGVCPIVTSAQAARGAADLSAVEGQVIKPAWRSNRIGGGPPRR